MAKQSNDIAETINDQVAEDGVYDAETSLVPFEAPQLPTIYPGADRALLTHHEKLRLDAYEDRYRTTTEALDDVRLKMPGTRLGITGVFIEEGIEVPERDPNTQQPIVDPATGEQRLLEKTRTMVRTSAWRLPGKNVVENDVYFSTLSPIAARFFQRLIDNYNAGRMGDFLGESVIPVEIYNHVYRNGHTGIGLKVVEEL